MKKIKKPGLADAQWATLRLILLPENYADLTNEQKDFLRTDIVRQLLAGEWPGVLTFSGGIPDSHGK